MTHKQDTIAVHSGLNHDTTFGSIIPPITLSSTYNFIGYNKPRAYDYSRRSNPTRDIVQHALTELELGAGTVITSSGMSAIYLVLMTFLSVHDVIVAPYDCYGGSYRLLKSLNERGFYQVRFINQSDHIELMKALEYKPKIIFIETPSNPLLRVVDIADICNQAHKIGALCVVDNTFMSPVLQNPLVLGADLVVHSCTKYLNGHSDVISGAVIAKDKTMTNELSWWGNNIGILSNPFDSYLLLRGIRTLIPRMRQQQSNAQAIITYLKTHQKVAKIYYPGLPENPGYDIACRQQKGFGAILSFEFKGNENMLRRFIDALELFTLAESLGGVESLISHTATMTHAGMEAEARTRAGISDNLLRISVGIENSEDLLADLAQAFQKAS